MHHKRKRHWMARATKYFCKPHKHPSTDEPRRQELLARIDEKEQVCHMVEFWDDIIDQANAVVVKLGEEKSTMVVCHGPRLARVYEDDLVMIAVAIGTGEVEVRRKENGNPVIWSTENGNYLRYHGEFSLIADHFFDLLKETDD